MSRQGSRRASQQAPQFAHRSARRQQVARGKRLLSLVSAAGAGLSLTHFVQAANYSWTWNNAGNASGTWATATNWTPNLPAPTGAADTVFFPSTGVTVDSTIVLGGPQTIGRTFPSFPDHSIVFGNHEGTGAASWTINASAVAANDATNILTIEAGTGPYEIIRVNDLGPGKVATINATVSNGSAGGLSLAKTGVGTLVLTAANTITGAFAINNGAMVLDFSRTWSPLTNILADNGTPGTTSSHLQLQGGTLVLQGKAAATNSQTFTNGTGLEFGASRVLFNQNGATSVSLNMGTLSRQVGATMDVSLPTSGSVTWAPGASGGAYPAEPIGTQAGTNGLMVDLNGSAYATVNGGTDWAANSGGNIVAASTVGGFYTASTATTLANNADVVGNVNLGASASVPSVRSTGARTVDVGGAANTLSVGGLLVPGASDTLTVQNGNLNSNITAANGDLIIHNNGTVNVSANIVNATVGSTVLTKDGSGTLILSGNNTYGGQGGGNTQAHAGTVVVNAGTTGIVAAGGNETNFEVAPAYGDRATLIVTGGTLNADRLLAGGNSANNAGGNGTIVQTGGVINSGQWFSMGGQGNGTFNMSGGVMNQNGNNGTQMEVGVFGIGRGTVNLSGSAQLNILNNGNIAMGVFDTAAGVFNQNGGTLTFYSDAGTTIGGTGNLIVGNNAGVSTYSLNGGVIKVGAINHGGTGVGNVNLNGGTILATRANANVLSAATTTRIQAGGAIIDSNGLTVTAAAAMAHHPSLGGTPDGGLTKVGSGTLRLSGASTYTGATTITSGTLQLVNTAGVPQPVGNYTFDNIRDTSNALVTSGSLGDNYTVVNGGTGGATMNGTVNNAENLLGPGTAGGSVVAGRFGNGVSWDGLGSSVDINSQVVDQSAGNPTTMSIWVNTTTPGGVFVGKNTGGVSWAQGNACFYLGDTAANGRPPGQLPTAVRHSGGFEQTNTPVGNGAWHMLTFVDTGAGRQIFVDGVLVALNEADFNGADTSTFVRLARNIDSFANIDGTTDYAGAMDELKFYNVALTAQQISELFNTNTVSTANSGAQYLPAATAVNITASGAALDINGVNQTIGSLQGVSGSLVTLGVATLTTGGNNTSTTFAGVISGTGGIVKAGNGNWTVSGANTYSGGTSVTGGTLTLATTGSLGSGGISASSGGVLDVSAGRATALKTPSLSITGGASVDLRDNDMVVGSATSKATIEGYVASARNGGAWTGSGITSTNARTNANHTTGLGVLSGAEYNSVGGTGTFSGQTYGATDTLVKYTWNGDANFDGRVTFDDYVKIDTGFNTHLTGWLNGDFNYSGAVNFDDYVLIDIAFNQQSGTLSRAVDWISGDDRSAAGLNGDAIGMVLGHLDQFGSAYGAAFLAAVPEPTTLALLGVPALARIVRRRRRPT